MIWIQVNYTSIKILGIIKHQILIQTNLVIKLHFIKLPERQLLDCKLIIMEVLILVNYLYDTHSLIMRQKIRYFMNYGGIYKNKQTILSTL